jgi:hypothetical protein
VVDRTDTDYCRLVGCMVVVVDTDLTLFYSSIIDKYQFAASIAEEY